MAPTHRSRLVLPYGQEVPRNVVVDVLGNALLHTVALADYDLVRDMYSLAPYTACGLSVPLSELTALAAMQLKERTCTCHDCLSIVGPHMHKECANCGEDALHAMNDYVCILCRNKLGS